ncbi:MAG: methyltransferase family protein [Candidatus Binatia bacterium]
MLLLLKNLVFTVLIPGTVALYLPWIIAAEGPAPSEPIATLGRHGAIAPLAGGACIYSWCLWDFMRFGRGTPAPIDAPRRLVVRGLYRYVRNPMYLGVLMVILGWAIYFVSALLALYGLSIGLVFHLFVVVYEEPTLRRRFGLQYENYSSRTNRWVPGDGAKRPRA